MEKQQVEDKFDRIEQALKLPDCGTSVGWMGIDFKFQVCAKSKGGNIKRGKAWGKLTYTNWLTGMPLNREQAIEWVLLPSAVKDAKYALATKKVCAICRKNGNDKAKNWGHLRYEGHYMDICPNCIKGIYDDSYRPWENN